MNPVLRSNRSMQACRQQHHQVAGLPRPVARAAAAACRPALQPALRLRVSALAASGERQDQAPSPRPGSPRPFDSRDYEDLLSTSVEECPHGRVEALMRSADAVLTAKTSETLQDLIPRLNKVSGLPVVDASNRVIGVISRKDIIRVRRAEGSLRARVSDHMTSPAYTVGPSVSVRQAAKLMMQHKIRRVPVVDGKGQALGLLSRSDIFKPLFTEEYEAFERKERAAMATGEGVKATWDVKYLYDGECPMCNSLKKVLERQDNRRGQLSFVDISDPYYDPMQNMGIEYEEAMETIHAIKTDGTVLQGTAALELMFETAGLGWAVNLMELPVISKIVDLLYEFLSANRISLGNTLDGIIAAKRIDMSKKGVETCGDLDEECTIEW